MLWMDDAPVPGGESPRGLAGEAGRGVAWCGEARSGRRVMARSGGVRQGPAGQGLAGMAGFGRAWLGLAGGVRRGLAGHGPVW